MALHENSSLSRDIEKRSGRSTHYRHLVYTYISVQSFIRPEGVTDREVMDALGVEDANLVRPEISRLKDDGLVRETSKTTCSTTRRQVRRVVTTNLPYTDRVQRTRAGKVRQRINHADDVIEMRLCEVDHVLLRPDQLYKFTVDPNCSKCQQAAASYRTNRADTE